MEQQILNPAEEAAQQCMQQVFAAIDNNKNFLVEAGAGAGKTYTLIKSLKYLIGLNSDSYLKSNKKIACITYTNVARDEIKSRTDNHPVIFAETIHAFSWQLIKDFQGVLRLMIPNLSDRWKERVDEVEGVGNRKVTYDLGYPKITDNEIYLHHDDVIRLMTGLLDDPKFQKIVKSKFPVILIDEYQDTKIDLANALVRNFILTETGPLIGFFGDHWQTIYGTASCGLISAPADKLLMIGKQANFRSDRLIVESLNKIRTELPQHVSDTESTGEIIIFHSNTWTGNRRTELHWKDDLPEDIAHAYLEKTKSTLQDSGWDINPKTTKILMLTNNVLANEQGYNTLFEAFQDPDDFLKKNDDYIALLSDVVEPGANAFADGKYGEMFKIFDTKSPKIRNQQDKITWHEDMLKLIQAREQGSIGNIIDLLKETNKPRLSRRVNEKENHYAELSQIAENERSEKDQLFFKKVQNMRAVPYSELVNMVKYIEDKTLFSTKHGVKGAEFENVVIVFGRGWNHYNWNQLLEWMKNGVPASKTQTYERNRNLFYVACSRPKKRLAMLFTQKMSADALTQLETVFGNNITPISLD